VPPLRERGEDTVLLAETFLAAAAARHDRAGVRLAPAALDLIRAHAWPGNVRQLKNEIERALLLSDGALVDLDDLRLRSPTGTSDLTAMESSERGTVERALREHAGNIKAAAKALGVSRGTLYRKIDKYGLDA
jgi:DNA-binding NtrC family response regulator